MLQAFRSVKAQAYFLLQLGYFKAKHVFFSFDLFEAQDDLAYLPEQYFPGPRLRTEARSTSGRGSSNNV